jgi:regulator of sigma E protease
MGQGGGREGSEEEMMSGAVSLLTKILAVGFGIGIIVLFHELGHFLMSKAVGLRVERFSIGFPPHIWKRKYGDTEYCIGAVPLGGYVKVDLGTSGETVSDIPWFHRSLVVLAGPFANLVLTALLIFAVLGIIGRDFPVQSSIVGSVPNQLNLAVGDTLLAVNGVAVRDYDDSMELLSLQPSGELLAGTRAGRKVMEYVLSDPHSQAYSPFVRPVIGEAAIGMPGFEAGLREGDSLVSINGNEITAFADLQRSVLSCTGADRFEIIYIRGGVLDTALVEPLEFDGVRRIGIVAAGESVTVRLPLFRALAVSGIAAIESAGAFYGGMIRLFSRPRELMQMSGGPVYVAETLGQQAGFGLARLLETISYISIAIMGFNLLPIPILDGGQFIFLLMEGIRRKPLSKRTIQITQQAGMILILVLFSAIIISDIHRVLTRVN